jgi:hypothetical protein
MLSVDITLSYLKYPSTNITQSPKFPYSIQKIGFFFKKFFLTKPKPGLGSLLLLSVFKREHLFTYECKHLETDKVFWVASTLYRRSGPTKRKSLGTENSMYV